MRQLPAPPRLDLALAAVIAVWWVLEVDVSDGASAVSLALMTIPLGWRRVAPFGSLVLVVAGFVVGATADAPPEPLASLLAILVSPYSAAAHATDRTRAWAAGAVAVSGAVAQGLIVGDDVVFLVVLVAAAWGAGMAVGRLAGRSAELEVKAATAAVEERERIARELHDVVSHSVSLMVVQAGAAEQVLRRDPAQAERALRALQATGREAVDDLRRMLGLLRGGDDHPLAPQPGLDRLDELVAAHGEPVEVRAGAHPDLPPGLDLTAYRIVQEALTNARKHAPGRPTSVRIGEAGGRLTIEVRTSASANGGAPAGAGHGLAGMRERAALYGGDLEAGREGADWVVRATLPVGSQ